MSQRDSGYQRKALDAYDTPEWVTETLVDSFPASERQTWGTIWEPAAGSGKMVRALRERGLPVIGTDLVANGFDFLSGRLLPDKDCRAIITNPPYVEADLFIAKALLMMHQPKGIVAMLLRTDFDHAKGRRLIFADHPAFCRKLVLTKRIQWFEGSKASPSFNHAWFIWNWRHQGPPTLAYGP